MTKEEEAKLLGDVERLRVQLAGCSVAARAKPESDAKPGDYGWSMAYHDVQKLRTERNELHDAITQLFALGEYDGHIAIAFNYKTEAEATVARLRRAAQLADNELPDWTVRQGPGDETSRRHGDASDG